MIVCNSTSDEKPDGNRARFADLIATHLVELARVASLIRQQSTLLSLADNRDSLALRRGLLETETAHYIAGLVNLGHDHGVDVLAGLSGERLRLVRLAVGPLMRGAQAADGSPDDETGIDPLAVFTDERLVEALYALVAAMRTWERHAAAEDADEASPDEIGDDLLERLTAVAAVVETIRREGKEARS